MRPKITWKGIKRKEAKVDSLKIGSITESEGVWRWESKFFKGTLVPVADSEFSAMEMVEKNFFIWWDRVLKGALK